MRTSNFFRYGGTAGVSIALSSPKFYKGPTYPDLQPTWQMLATYQVMRSETLYHKAYTKEILAKLDAQVVYDRLKDSVILCWCKPGAFCHRRLVADWIEQELGITVPEL